MENVMETVKIEKRGRGRPKTKPDAMKSSLLGEKKKIKYNTSIIGAPAGNVDENHGKAENIATSTTRAKLEPGPLDAQMDPLQLHSVFVAPDGSQLVPFAEDGYYAIRVSEAKMQRLLDERRIYAQNGALFMRDA